MKKESLMLTRRSLMALGTMTGLAACANSPIEPVSRVITPPPIPPLPNFYGAIIVEPHPIPAVPEGILSPDHWRQEVANPWPDHASGTIVIDPDAAILHFVETPEKAMRYGVSVGAAGFAWDGTARLQFRRA